MKRRTLLGLGVGSLLPLAGCVRGDLLPGSGSLTSTTFDLVDPEIGAEDPPTVAVTGDTVTVRGTVQYASSSCGTAELAHLGFEPSQHRLDVLVVAADDSVGTSGCTDDIATTGYRLETTVSGQLRRIAATEHHAFGETVSTTTDLTD